MANVDIRVGKKDAVFFAANPTLILKDGQFLFNSDTLELFIGDGTTQLSALVAINAPTPNWQQVTDEGASTTNRVDFNGLTDGLNKVYISPTDNGAGVIVIKDNANTETVQLTGDSGLAIYDSTNNPLFTVDRSSGVDQAFYKSVEIATVNDIPTVDTTIIDGSTNPVSGNAVFDGLATKAPLNTLSNIFSLCTVVGWSSYTTSVVDVIDLGNVYMVNINISGTSNAATTTVQLPYTNNGNALLADMTLGTNGGSNITGRWVIASGSATILFNTTAGAGNYSNSGTKTVYASLMLPK